MINSLLLSASLAIGTPDGTTMPTNDAARYAAKAAYKQLELDRVVSNLEKKYINVDQYPELVYIGVIGRICIERRITWTWTY